MHVDVDVCVQSPVGYKDITGEGLPWNPLLLYMQLRNLNARRSEWRLLRNGAGAEGVDPVFVLTWLRCMSMFLYDYLCV